MKNNITSEIEQDIRIILNSLKSPYELEKDFSINQLMIYLNIKKAYVDEIIEGISTFFKSEIEIIEEIYFYKVLNIFCSKLEENNLSTTKFINKMFPFLMNKIYTYKYTKQKDDELFNTISNFIKKSENNVGQIELCLNKIFDKLNESKNQLDDNAKYGLITTLSNFLHNAPIISFYKIMKSSTEFKKIISDFKNKNKNIRKSVQKLIEEFLFILLNKESIVRKAQSEDIIYNTCIKDYIGKYDNNEFLIHGLILVLKSFTIKNPKNEKQINEFFMEKYKIFLDYLYSNLSSENYLIKFTIIEALEKYCEFLPYILNEKEYLEYFRKILKDLINIYSGKDINEKIKSEILKTLGKMSLLKEFIEPFSENIDTILEIISKDFTENKAYNENILECLSNIMTTYDTEFFDILPFNVLYEKIFSYGLKESSVLFFKKLLFLFSRNSRENIQITLCLLNAISLIITQKEFIFKYSQKKMQFISNENHEEDSSNLNIDKYISEKCVYSNSPIQSPKHINERIISLDLVKSLSTPVNGCLNFNDMKYFHEVGKIISEYIKDKKSKGISFSNEIKNGLKLLGFMNNKYFEKEILNFYKENCIKLLKKNDKEIKSIIISLGNAPWIPKYDQKITSINNDDNLKFIFQYFLDLLIVELDDDIKLLILKIFEEPRYLQLLIKDNYFLKFVSLVEYDSNLIKEKTVQIISKLIPYNYNRINTYIKRKITQICLFLVTSNNQYRQEKKIILLTYFIKYTGNCIVDSMEMIFTNSLKILKKGVSNDLNSSDLKNQNDIIILRVLSVIGELMNNQYYNKTQLDEYLNDIMSITINLLEDNITSSSIKEEKALYTILSILTNSDKDWKIYSDYINLVRLIIEVLSKSQNKQSRLYALKIFGHIGIINPDKLEIILDLNNVKNENGVNEFYIADEINNYSDTEIIHQKNELMEAVKNPKDKRQINKINVSQSILNMDKGKIKIIFDFKKAIREKKLNSTLYYSIRTLMKILLNNNNYHTNIRIITILKDFIAKLNESDYPVIYLILPTLLYSIDNFDDNKKIEILEIILFIIKSYTKECLPFIENITLYTLEETKNTKFLKYNIERLSRDKCLEILDKLCELYSNEISPFYDRIIPIILNLLSDKDDISASNKRKIISCLIHIGNSLSNYFSLVIPKLTDYLFSLINKKKLSSYVNNSQNDKGEIIQNNKENLILNDHCTNNNLISSIFSKVTKNNMDRDMIFIHEQTFDSKEKKEEKMLEEDILYLISLLLDLPGIINYMERIIFTLCTFLETEPSTQKNIMIIFCKILSNFKEEFLFFFPSIIKKIKKISIPYSAFFHEFRSGLEKQTIISLINKDNLNDDKILISQGHLESDILTLKNDLNINNIIKEYNIQKNRINSQHFMDSNSNTDGIKSLNNNSFNSGISKRKPSFLNKFHINNKSSNKTINRELFLDSLVKEFDTKNCLSEDDWHEWFKVSSKKLFEQSPSYILFLCHKNNVCDQQIVNELYNSAFYSLWSVCSNNLKQKLVKYLQFILKNPKTPDDILLKLFNLIEFINKEENEQIELIEFEQLGEIANICKAHAKALYYVENGYINNDSSDDLKKLINLYIDLELSESATGIYRLAQMKSKISFNNLLNEKDLHLKLHQWKKAIQKIEEQQKKDENGKFIYNLNDEEDKNLLIKKAYCLEGLSDWEKLLELGDDLSKINLENQKNESDNKKEDLNLNISLVLSKAALNLGQWDKLKIYSNNIKSVEDDEIYEENFFKAIVAIKDKEYDNAEKYIDIARDSIDDKIKTLLNESYERAYKLLLDNENLCQLEDIIKLNKYNFNQKKYKEKKEELKLQWDKCLELKKEDIKAYERIIGIRRIILTPEEDYLASLELSQICRRKDKFTTCMLVLNRLQNSLKNCEPDVTARVSLAIGKFIHDDNDDPNNLDKAIKELKKIVNININKVVDELKSKIYCYYGMWRAEKIEKNLNEKDVNNILHDLELSTKYNQNNYKSWHSYALLNYKFFQYIQKTKINYAINAIEGFVKSIDIGGKNTSKILQDLLLLLNIWFQVGMEESIDKLMNEKIDIISLDSWFLVIPQLLTRINVTNPLIRNTLIFLLKKIGLKNPRSLTYSLTVLQNSKSKIRAEAVALILKDLKKEYQQLFKECELITNELNRCALCLHEQWSETIEESAKLFFQSKDIKSSIKLLSELHKKMQNPPKTMNEIHFHQIYRSELKEAYKLLKDYLENENLTSIKEAWDIYHSCFKSISNNFSNIELLDLKSISPDLFKFHESEIEIPGIYQNMGNDVSNSIVKISSFSRNLIVFKSKQHPRKIIIYGSDGKEYPYLLKGHEDIRQDERVMQLFGLINTLLSKDSDTREKNLYIKRYPVIPLSHNTGLIGWVSNCDTLHQLIRDYRQINNIPLNLEYNLMEKFYPKFDKSLSITKLEVFKHALNNTMGIDLYKVLWNKSQNAEDWLDRRTNYSRSLAVMSIVGYILGLGDRHPSNIMLDRISGKVLHIDFDDCFEVAMKREKFPEKVPFRLTRMLIKALEIGGIEGTFRITCENVMRVVRGNKDSLNVILAAFVHDPLISFRLLIPLLMKQSKNKNKISNDDNIKESEVEEKSKSTKKVIETIMNSNKKNENEFAKKVKKRMGSDERKLYNELEEKDDTESDDLNQIVKIVLERVSDKLKGTDFNKNEELKIYEQVQRLIRQATSHENLSQSYLGWCPFW